MSLQANKTHTYQTQALAVSAAKKAELDPNDLHFYRASKRWGWCTKAEAEADEQASSPVVEGEDEQSADAILARNAARAAAQKALEASTVPPVVESHPEVQEATAAVLAAPALVSEVTVPETQAVSFAGAEGMVVIAVQAGNDAGMLADILHVACNADVTAINPKTREALWVVPAHPVRFVDKEGKEPNLVEAAFIAGAFGGNGITSTEFAARCASLGLKPPADLCGLGEQVQGYGPTYHVTPEQVSNTRVDLRHLLASATE